MKKSKTTGTYSETLRLLRDAGQTAPSRERVEMTRWILQTCKENAWTFTAWDEPLYPALDSFGDVELLTAIEETFGVVLDEAEMWAAPLHSLGDLVTYLEPHLVSFLYLLGYESAHVARAACATQAAFYGVRRRLCEAGASYSAVHTLRPSTRLRHLTNEQAKAFARGLRTDYGLDIPLRHFLWGWLEAEAAVLALLLVSAVFCLCVALQVLGGAFSGTVLWIVLNALHVGFVCHAARYKWPRGYRTLGDVARKIADAAPVPQAAR